MEIIFNYETAKHTLVLTAYMALIFFDCYMIGYILISTLKWCYKKIKGLFHKNKNEVKEDSSNE